VASLQKNIAALNFQHRQSITCSFGITKYKSNESSDSFINRGDKAMYQAKRAGKNTVKVLS